MRNFLSVQEVAKLLGISKVTVINQIKAGKIQAEKVGNSYIINKNEIPLITDNEVSEEQKQTIQQGVKKTIKEYGETLRLLKDA